MKTKDKDLLVNPLADVKPPREGPTFVEQKKAAAKSLWGSIKDAMSEWSFGSGVVPPPPPRRRGGLSGLEDFRPDTPMPQVKKPKCERCGSNDCLNREEMQQLRQRAGRQSGTSLGNSLLRSCEVRRQLKEMEKFRVRTSSGKDVWMTKQGRIERPPKPQMPPNEIIGGRPIKPPPPPNPPKPFSRARDEELVKLKAENAALKAIMDDKLKVVIKEEKEKDAEMKRYHDEKRHKDTAEASEILRRIRARGRTRPPVR